VFTSAALTSKELDWSCDLVSSVKFIPYMKQIVDEEFWPLPASAGLISVRARLSLFFSFHGLYVS